MPADPTSDRVRDVLDTTSEVKADREILLSVVSGLGFGTEKERWRFTLRRDVAAPEDWMLMKAERV